MLIKGKWYRDLGGDIEEFVAIQDGGG